MSRFRAILFCGLVAAPASAEELAPVALNSLSAAPSNVASLRVMDQKGQVIGQALRIQTDQDGHPSALAFRASNGNTVMISAAATSYDGHALVTSNDQPQIAALSALRTAAN
jgi:nitrous oxidase accessory protein NosD